MEAVFERECGALGGLFHTVISDMKSSYPVWEDFISKAGKFQSQLRTTVVAAAAFLDALQKVADLAMGARGGTRDIGSALTRRSIEARLRKFSASFIDCLIIPLQDQMEEWKRGVNTLDKDHAKDYKKARQEIRRISSETQKLQKKAKKGKGDLRLQRGGAMQGVSNKYLVLEETETQALRKALQEERGRFCTFVSMLQPVLDEEIAMLGEITHLQAITDDLKVLTVDPHKLPPASEQVILDLKGSDYTWSRQTPPPSPSIGSRKSSMCSSLNSVNSSDSRSPSALYCHRGGAVPLQPSGRLYSVSSQDSGFVSQDAFPSKSPSPMPPEAVSQMYPSPISPELPGTPQAVSEGDPLTPAEKPGRCHRYPPTTPPHPPEKGDPEPHFPVPPPSSASSPLWAWPGPCHAPLPSYTPFCPLGPGMIPSTRVPSWKDWAKPGPYDQPMVNTLKKPKRTPEQAETRRAVSQSGGVPPLRDTRALTASGTDKEEIQAHQELALSLARGLPPDPQGSGSSGYSSQSPTPCSSEDALPSEVSDCDYFSIGGEQEVDGRDFEKCSTILRNGDISQSYIRVTQARRPPSTGGSAHPTPGVATIRRTPSTKTPGRRPVGVSAIPVRTPSVPDSAGGMSYGIAGGAGLGADSVASQGHDILLAIRQGVRLKKTMTNDKSTPHVT
nr:metastasis suppressor protein 1-like isoform X1 [Paramormyrops kingsleyae]